MREQRGSESWLPALASRAAPLGLAAVGWHGPVTWGARSPGDGAALSGVSPARPRLLRPQLLGPSPQDRSGEPRGSGAERRDIPAAAAASDRGESWVTVRTSLLLESAGRGGLFI